MTIRIGSQEVDVGVVEEILVPKHKENLCGLDYPEAARMVCKGGDDYEARDEWQERKKKKIFPKKIIFD